MALRILRWRYILGGAYSASTLDGVSPPLLPLFSLLFLSGGDGGGSGDTFHLPLDTVDSTSLPLLDDIKHLSAVLIVTVYFLAAHAQTART